MSGPSLYQGSEIQYNVEHVFEEDGREVRKMPIKVNGETLWVDCVPQVGHQRIIIMTACKKSASLFI